VAANVSVNILNATGGNLLGQTITGNADTYPGNPDGVGVALNPGHTRNVTWVMADTTSTPETDPNVAFTVRVTSDQPIVVGAHFHFNGDIPSQCSLLPK
jgi:urease beta subunit